jgi:hypothetical protein
MRKLCTAFSLERGLQGCRVRLRPVATDQPEGAHPYSGVLAVAYVQGLEPWQEGRRMAAGRRTLPARRQRDPALLVRGASVRHT